MAVPKLHVALSKLSPQEVTRFGLWLESGLHHGHEETLQLWRAMVAHLPDLDLPDARLWRQAFPRRTYSNPRLRVLRTYLLAQLRAFLTWGELTRDEMMQEQLLLRASWRLQTDALGAASQPLHEDTLLSPRRASHAFLLLEDMLARSIKDGNRSLEHPLEQVLLPLDVHFTATRLKFLCGLVDRTHEQIPASDVPGLEPILAFCEQAGLLGQPLIALYHHTLCVLLGRHREHHLDAVIPLLVQHAPRLEPDDTMNLFSFLINHQARRHVRGDPQALRAVFDLYQKLMEHDLLFSLGSFTANHFKNILSVSIQLGEYAWAESFLAASAHRLDDQYRQALVAWGRANLLVAQGRPAEAKRHLQDVEFFDPFYRLSHHILLLRIYYETLEWEAFESLGIALREWLRRNKLISPDRRDAALNLLRFTSRLFQLRAQSYRRNKVGTLYRKVLNTPNITERSWLMARIAEVLD